MSILATSHVIQGVILFKGEDNIRFLQGQLTCDVEQLSDSKAMIGAYCTPNGRIRSNFILVKVQDDELLMIVDQTQTTYLLESMAPYIAFFKTEMSDVSEQYNCFGLKSNANQETETIGDINLNELPQSSWESSLQSDIQFIRFPFDTPSWLCLAKSDHLISGISTSAEWLIDELNAGLVWINESNRETFLPHDLSLPQIGAVSFEKGCYTGQEIVARMHYRGKPKYQLALIKTEPTDEVFSEDKIKILEEDKEIKSGNVVQIVKMNDKSYLICASVKSLLLKEPHFQLLSNERSILSSIKLPKLIKESHDK